MQDEHNSDSGIDAGDGNGVREDHGRDIFIDPDSLGGNQGRASPPSGENGGDSGTSFTDGYGPLGQFGRGRFPDGRSRKRSAHGARNGDNQSTGGTASPRAPRANSRVSASGIEFILISLHAGISSVIEKGYQDKIIPLEEDDAKRLSIAIANVSKYYPVLQQSGKVADHIALIGTAALIYGPMAMRLYMRDKEEKRQHALRKRGPSIVHPFPVPQQDIQTTGADFPPTG
jgi:hypothetical protein